jgi:hypothetical protein
VTFTAYPGALEELTAAKLQALISELRPLYVRKSADETVNNSTVLQNDDHLFLAMVANVTYELTGLLRYTCASVTPEIQIDFTFPSLTTMEYFGAGPGVNVTGQEGNLSAYSPRSTTSPVGAVFYGTNNSAAFALGISLRGLVRVGANAGNLQLRWAQTVATATDLKMLTDSYLLLRRVD